MRIGAELVLPDHRRTETWGDAQARGFLSQLILKEGASLLPHSYGFLALFV
jgi:hypothetical protein